MIDDGYWWEKWGARYKPVSWKAWVAIAVWSLLLAILGSIGEILGKSLRLSNPRDIPAILALVWAFCGYRFAKRHTKP